MRFDPDLFGDALGGVGKKRPERLGDDT